MGEMTARERLEWEILQYIIIDNKRPLDELKAEAKQMAEVVMQVRERGVPINEIH